MDYIERKDLYRHDDTPELKERTKARLTQLYKLGMTEVGVAQFGINGLISGIYIERVWNYDDKEWDAYVEWMEDVINRDKP